MTIDRIDIAPFPKDEDKYQQLHGTNVVKHCKDVQGQLNNVSTITMHRQSLLWALFLVVASMLDTSFAFVLCPARSSRWYLCSTPDESDGNNQRPKDSTNGMSRKEKSEVFMESASAAGAAKIAAMSIPERTKRAMLAEAIEDRIFQLQDDLEELIPDGSTIPTDENTRAHCVDIAKEIRVAQGQYEDLVSGRQSDVLENLENLGNFSGEDGDDKSEE